MTTEEFITRVKALTDVERAAFRQLRLDMQSREALMGVMAADLISEAERHLLMHYWRKVVA